MLAAAIMLMSCEKEPQVTSTRENEVIIQEKYYEIRSAKYLDGYYDFIGEDCIRLHLQFTQNGETVGAGMTIEMSTTLLGEKVSIEPSESFWYFHVGTGRASLSLESTYEHEKFGTRSGWFTIDYGDKPDEIIFEWELLNNNGAVTTSEGYIREIFIRE